MMILLFKGGINMKLLIVIIAVLGLVFLYQITSLVRKINSNKVIKSSLYGRQNKKVTIKKKKIK